MLTLLYFELEYVNEESKKAKTKVGRRRKKRKKEETVKKTIDGSQMSEIFWSSFCRATEGKLTALELEDLIVEGSVFACGS